MKINPYSSNYTYLKHQDTPSKTKLYQVKQQITNLPMDNAAVIGRSIVNFGQKEFKLIKEDRIFVKNIAESMRLSEYEATLLGIIIEKYMMDNNIKTLDDIGDDDSLDDQVALIDTISQHFPLPDNDYAIISAELTQRTIFKENYKYNPDSKFNRDIMPLIYFAEKHNLSEKVSGVLFEDLKQIANKHKLKSVFDIFNISINKNIRNDLAVFNILNKDQNEKADIAIDFSTFAIKNDYERDLYIKACDKKNLTLNNVINMEIASKILNNYNLGSNAKDFVLGILEQRENQPYEEKGFKPKSNAEVAFLIADEFDLPSSADKEIKALLERAITNPYAMLNLENDLEL